MTKKNTLKFKYIFPDDFCPEYANGAQGGVTPRGEILMNFFLERQPVPKSIVYEMGDDGMIGDVIQDECEPREFQHMMVRNVTCGVMMNLETARQVRDWLDNQIRTAEGAESVKEEGDA
jgi:hypothetical protein